MLKLNYTEVGLYMEHVTTSVELAIAQRVVLAMRLGQALYVEPSQASFLLAADTPELIHLEMALQKDRNDGVMVIPVDSEFVEISLWGTWIADAPDAHEGMFLTMMGDRVELFVYKLWQMSDARISSLA